MGSSSRVVVELERKICQQQPDYGCEEVHHGSKFVKPDRNYYWHTILFSPLGLIRYATWF